MISAVYVSDFKKIGEFIGQGGYSKKTGQVENANFGSNFPPPVTSKTVLDSAFLFLLQLKNFDAVSLPSNSDNFTKDAMFCLIFSELHVRVRSFISSPLH